MVNKKPTVSLIIPVYNGEKFLEKALNSVLNQSFQDFEVICINDGSSDNSLYILNKYKSEDDRIIVITQENKGVSSARNMGLKKASGEYVMFLDNDDFLHYQCMELAVQAMKNSQADVCQFGWKSIGLDEKVSDITYNKIGLIKIIKDPLAKYLSKKFDKSVLIWDKIYKTELAKKIFFRDVQPGEDDLYAFETMAYSRSMAFINLKILYHQCNPESVMHVINHDKYYENRLKVVDECFDIIKNLCIFYGTDEKVQRKLKQYYGERFLFKEYIAKPLRNKIKNVNLPVHITLVCNQLKENDIPLKWRFKFVLWLLKKHYNIFARMALG